MSAADYLVKGFALASFDCKDLVIAKTEMPGLMIEQAMAQCMDPTPRGTRTHLDDEGISLLSGKLVDATFLDEEQVQRLRPRDGVHKEGQRLILRHEGAHRLGCEQRSDTQPWYVLGTP